jgi:small neutral amino acid transporter SnatA (MarC family)
MKFFLILFGLVVMFVAFEIVLYTNTYDEGLAFILKGILGVTLFCMGIYLVYQGIQEFKRKFNTTIKSTL